MAISHKNADNVENIRHKTSKHVTKKTGLFEQ
jgi:hypothetical protein